MEAKDTVVSSLAIANIIDNRPGYDFFQTGEYIASRQAEISFKAGIREVVEWVEKHNFSHNWQEWHYYRFGRDEWQAKLKEWGILAPTGE